MQPWKSRDSAELYNVSGWGGGYFDVNEKGHTCVLPYGPGGPTIDLKTVVQDLVRRGLSMPLLLRFSDILRMRVESLNEAFMRKIDEYEYDGRYRAVMPIKVNQQRHVIEELIEYGKPFQLGLEAGSKPELLIALALLDQPDGLIICNGYKDEAYLESAMLAERIGRKTLIIIDRFEELEMVIQVSQRLGIKPNLGVRAKLSTRGSGKWAESGGDRSKFGLTASQLVHVVARLREVELLDRLVCLHFHIGSQITAIRAIKDAMNEGSRIFADLYKMGAPLAYFDVGGGLAVDYDGSNTNFHASRNYSLEEYAGDIVWAIKNVLSPEGIPHPTVISESGRALVAHHAVLIFNVVGESMPLGEETPASPPTGTEEHAVIDDLRELFNTVSTKNVMEFFHDAVQLKDDALSLYRHGIFNLEQRGLAESLFWAIARKIWKLAKGMEYTPEELEPLERALAHTYYCNFSVFQSVPDSWAIKQLFPVMPIHRLHEEPTQQVILADLTCDSDGKMDRFIDLHDVRPVLDVHPLRKDDPYIMGVFLVGAYQETLGDLHNLFGDTHAVHLAYDQDSGYRILHVEEGDTVRDVLSYVEYDQRNLMARLRQSIELSLREGRMTFEESASLLRRFEEDLNGSTYLKSPELSEIMLSSIVREAEDSRDLPTPEKADQPSTPPSLLSVVPKG